MLNVKTVLLQYLPPFFLLLIIIKATDSCIIKMVVINQSLLWETQLDLKNNDASF